MADEGRFQGAIVVASRIVDYLSSGLYESPAACLKELINNSFDADAKRVNVFVKPDADRIIIEDDGFGLNKDEFEKHFRRISESYKREESNTTPSGRPKIGKIGIGFIAANEICDVMEIVSTKKGSTELLEVSIQFFLMREDPEERRRSNGAMAKADYEGVVTSVANKNSHYTHIFLKKIRGEAQAILAGAGTTEFSAGKKSLYGKLPSTMCKILAERGLKSWDTFDDYSKNLLKIGLNVPVAYHDEWILPTLKSKVEDIERSASELNFSLFIDGSEIRKPIVFSPPEPEKTIVTQFNFKGENVAAKGYFYAQYSMIRPQELQGVLIRIRNAAVGEYDPSFLGFSSSEGPLFQAWISGEIIADDRLEEAMNIDRRTLREAHSAYTELQQAVHEHISELIKRVRNEIYGERSKAQQASKAQDIVQKISDVADKQIADVSPKAASAIKKSWSDTAREKPNQKQLLKKFPVNQFYEIVVEVAKDVLNQRQLEEFLSRLTERLKK